jgi:2-dehydro-3-deoxygluconokinase
MTVNQQSHGATRIVCFGEVLLRLAAPAPQLLLQEMRMEASFCGAEANVAVALAGLGHEAALVTALPANAVGAAARRMIAGMGVQEQMLECEASRMGLYFLQPGAMARPASITYDRAGSAFASIDPRRYDWDRLLDGAGWLFASGITPALGDGPLAALHDAVDAAKARGVRIAFDTNFRPTLWRGREQLAAEVLRDFSLEASLVFAGRRATAMMAGGSYDHADPADGFHAAAHRLFDLSPRLQAVSATRRLVHSSDRQDLTGLLADREGLSTTGVVQLEAIVDRVGTGDAFAAGILHGLIAKLSRQETVDFATACSRWAHSVPGDFLRASLADIESLSSSTGDVRR